MTCITINLANDFCDAPALRYERDGNFSGEKFREGFLRPTIEAKYRVAIDMGGVIGVSSAFLEEAFGGLVRVNGFSLETLKSQLHILPPDSAYAMEIGEHIEKTAALKVSHIKTGRRHECFNCPYTDERFNGHCLYFGDMLCKMKLLEAGCIDIIKSMSASPDHDWERSWLTPP